MPENPELIYLKKKPVYLNTDTWAGLPSWISDNAKRAIFRSIANAITTNVLQLNAPVLVATQLQLSLRDLLDVHTIFLRAMPRFQGIVAQDCVKVLIDEDSDDGGTKKKRVLWKMHGVFPRLRGQTICGPPMVYQA